MVTPSLSASSGRPEETDPLGRFGVTATRSSCLGSAPAVTHFCSCWAVGSAITACSCNACWSNTRPTLTVVVVDAASCIHRTKCCSTPSSSICHDPVLVTTTTAGKPFGPSACVPNCVPDAVFKFDTHQCNDAADIAVSDTKPLFLLSSRSTTASCNGASSTRVSSKQKATRSLSHFLVMACSIHRKLLMGGRASSLLCLHTGCTLLQPHFTHCHRIAAGCVEMNSMPPHLLHERSRVASIALPVVPHVNSAGSFTPPVFCMCIMCSCTSVPPPPCLNDSCCSLPCARSRSTKQCLQ